MGSRVLKVTRTPESSGVPALPMLEELLVSVRRWAVHADAGDDDLARRWGEGVESVVLRVMRSTRLDAQGHELGVNAWLSGFMVGLYGQQAVIAHCMSQAYWRDSRSYVAPDGRMRGRLFDMLRRAGERQGREAERKRNQRLLEGERESMAGAADRMECSALDKVASVSHRHAGRSRFLDS